MSTEQITMDEVHARREECKALIAMNEAMVRLHNNADFKAVFLTGYAKDESIRLVHLLGDTNLNARDNADVVCKDIHNRMIGIAKFVEYCRYVELMGDRAKHQLESLDTALETQANLQ